MNAQGLDAQGKEDQMEKSDGGATSPLQHGVMCDFATGDIVYLVDDWEKHHAFTVWKIFDDGKVQVKDINGTLLCYDQNDLIEKSA
jgi:hypothetical protein